MLNLQSEGLLSPLVSLPVKSEWLMQRRQLPRPAYEAIEMLVAATAKFQTQKIAYLAPKPLN